MNTHAFKLIFDFKGQNLQCTYINRQLVFKVTDLLNVLKQQNELSLADLVTANDFIYLDEELYLKESGVNRAIEVTQNSNSHEFEEFLMLLNCTLDNLKSVDYIELF